MKCGPAVTIAWIAAARIETPVAAIQSKESPQRYAFVHGLCGLVGLAPI
jgi:hypothetical protein